MRNKKQPPEPPTSRDQEPILDEQGWSRILELRSKEGFYSPGVASTRAMIEQSDEKTRRAMEQSITRAVETRLYMENQSKIKKSTVMSTFLGTAALFLVEMSDREETLEKAMKWMEHGLNYSYWHFTRASSKENYAYVDAMVDCLIELDRPDLFKRWANYCQVDILVPYIQACSKDKRKIMGEFSDRQPKREDNRALEFSISYRNWDMFCFLLEHSNPRKKDSRLLADMAIEIASTEKRIQNTIVVGGSTHNKRKVGVFALKEDLLFLEKAFPELARVSDPVMSLFNLKKKNKKNARVEELMLSVMDARMMNRAAKDPVVCSLFPTIGSWKARGELARKASRSRAKNRQEKMSSKPMKL